LNTSSSLVVAEGMIFMVVVVVVAVIVLTTHLVRLSQPQRFQGVEVQLNLL
jgi:hypothetical protein